MCNRNSFRPSLLLGACLRHVYFSKSIYCKSKPHKINFRISFYTRNKYSVKSHSHQTTQKDFVNHFVAKRNTFSDNYSHRRKGMSPLLQVFMTYVQMLGACKRERVCVLWTKLYVEKSPPWISALAGKLPQSWVQINQFWNLPNVTVDRYRDLCSLTSKVPGPLRANEMTTASG